MLEKPKGQSRMDNPEKLTTLGTQDEDKHKKQKQKNKNNTHTSQYVMDTTIRKQTHIT